MGGRRSYVKYWVAQSGAATVTGVGLKCPYNGRLSATFEWTGTLSGTIALQHRHRDGSWLATPGASTEFTSQPAGSASSVACNWANMPGEEFRFVYTASSGTGNLTANLGLGDDPE